MFLFLDESSQYNKKLIGCILIPKDLVPEIEKEFVKLRIKHKLFGEIKWSKIGKYYERYIDFINLFFDYKDITFHSICYRYSNKKYNAAYLLLRTISWKLQNVSIDKSLYVLFDDYGTKGALETEEIKNIAGKDRNFKHKLEFCNQGGSHILGCLQLVDIITGAVCSVVNNITFSNHKQLIVEYITKMNSSIPLSFSSMRLPRLNEYKIHYFDPDNRNATKIVAKTYSLANS